MRLLKVDTLEFVEFFEDRVPPYAILSHTWREEEVSYREMLQPITGATQAKEGYKKIKGFASLVSQTQWGYIWVDTCCINKDSSAELTEAINSMYRWYKNSGRCYVYLDDTCRWKTRGWTLQELIAPIEVHFYTCGWDFIFTKAELIYEIADLLKIEVGVLLSSDPSTASIAQRMCWASSRTTSRSEDMAYCLMGLFDVNMPLLYGEGGEKAFLRLQEEILKTSEDNSIFAWTLQDAHWSFHAGLLATCPAQFRHSAHIEWQHWNTNEEQTLPAHTKMGVSLTMATQIPGLRM
ncbi:HET-domain-containing protein [Xylariaceae sp. FL1651]|nr:HET-domain-containing protein [Xylariaceae sp. FL1651]